jgi:transcriptional regulator with XRE-family HTH domain
LTSEFSLRLKRLREKRGWTQSDLARALKVQQSTVSRWEGGLTEPVGLYAGIEATVTRLERKHQVQR